MVFREVTGLARPEASGIVRVTHLKRVTSFQTKKPTNQRRFVGFNGFSLRMDDWLSPVAGDEGLLWGTTCGLENRFSGSP